jgi:hypothetical protein
LSKQHFYTGLLNQAKYLLSGLLLSAAIVPHASAHLMVAQKGTLNFVNDGAFLVLSIPVSAFENIDDNGDKKLSKIEFTKHRAAIVAAVKEKVTLEDKTGLLTLEGMMLSPVASHQSPLLPSEQLIIMGRFQLKDLDSKLHFQLGLYGTKPEEQSLGFTATWKSKSQKHKTEFTQKIPKIALFPSKTE